MKRSAFGPKHVVFREEKGENHASVVLFLTQLTGKLQCCLDCIYLDPVIPLSDVNKLGCQGFVMTILFKKVLEKLMF